MNDRFERLSAMSPKRLALLALELQERLDRAERAPHEPIAITGIGCRLPGADGPDAFWELLRDGVDAVREVPRDRWDIDAYYDPDPDTPGKMATRWGGFLDEVDRFEPQLFGIAPREARSLDPQQRLLLEVAWEALEHAGIAPDSLQGTRTGVYVGICGGDYCQMLMSSDDDQLDMYASTGNAPSVASGRVAYVLGLQGPAMTIDTSCSSSLVALHLAARDLRAGACRTALAGGVNVIINPKSTITLSRAKMMAPDGRCKSFDASGDGFVRGEGCGLVVVKKLSDAIADGDRVLALLRGSAVNQDGRSNGLTAPNGPSQVSVLRAALDDAGVEPAEVSYVEAHGTGTSLGDPIEAQSLGTALGGGRGEDQRLKVGSVKTNLGHLEAAAGIAGLIKVVLSMQHEQLPPSLHFHDPSPHIPWDTLPLDIVTEPTPWPDGGAPRIAGVSSFGFSGTNAHVVLESAPRPEEPADATERPLHVLELAASGEQALRDVAERYADHLATRPPDRFADIAFTANVGRADLSDRLAVVAPDSATARDRLEDFLAGTTSDDVLTGVAGHQRTPTVAFLFTGHGSQYVGMGRALYDAQPVFREAIGRCAELLGPEMDRPLLDVLFSSEPDAELGVQLLDSMAYAQPALFALEYALAEMWRSWGVRPTAVAGHSAGEYVAAVVAGAMRLEDGLKLIAARGRLMASLPPDGEMATALTTEDRVRQAIDAAGGQVSIAAINGPESIAISGTGGALPAVLDALRADGVEVRPLAIPIAAHSPQVEPILDEFETVASSVQFSPPQLDVVSGMTGALAEGSDLVSAAYWRRHLREPVRFADAFRTIHDEGTRIFVEIGPHPTLLNMGRHIVPEHECAWLPSLRSGHDEWIQLLRSVAALYVRGAVFDWAAFDAPYPRRKVTLPTYPFQRERHWVESGRRRSPHAVGRPLLGRQLSSPALDRFVFESDVAATWPAFLDHHRVLGTVLMPSPAYVEMASSAADEVLGDGPYAVRDLSIREGLLLPDDAERTLQLVVEPVDDGATLEFYSRDASGTDWTLHATADLAPAATPSSTGLDLDDVKERCAEHVDGEEYYARLFDLGLEFGPGFQGVTDIWRRDGEALGRVVLPDAVADEAGEYGIHPALLDACFHVLGAPLVAGDEDKAYLLIGIDRFTLRERPGEEVWSHTVLHEGYDDDRSTFSGDIRVYTGDGRLVAEALGLQLKHASRDALVGAARQHGKDWLYEVDWVPAEPVSTTADRPGADDVARALEPRLTTSSRDHGIDQYETLMVELDRMAIEHAASALSELGLQTGTPFASDELAEHLGVEERHRRLLARLTTILADAGHLRRDGDSWEVVAPVPDDSVTPAELLARFPGSEVEIGLVDRCGGALADVLSGRTDGLELLFPSGSKDDVAAVYGDTPAARVLNSLVGDAVATIVDDAQPPRPLRVLEVGAGTGATAASVIDELPAGSEYWFTDISPAFLAAAEERFGDAGALRTELLDIERDPAAQGLPAESFDVVIAANVLHATADLGRSLEHARRLLAPGGALLLVETVGAGPRVDVTFGLTEGWWRFTDKDLRPDVPLLDVGRWLRVLEATGFEGATTVSRSADGDAVGQALLIATAGSEAGRSAGPRDWLLLGEGGGLAKALADRLNAVGERVTSLPVVPAHDELVQAIGQLAEGHRTVVDLGALEIQPIEKLDLDDLAAAELEANAGALEVAQAIAAGDLAAELWVVTRGAQPAGSVVEAPEQSTLWGLGRVIALEHPELWGGLIDLGSGSDLASDAAAIVEEIGTDDVDDQTAVRDGERLVPRLVRRDAGAAVPYEWRDDASYLVTGGLGGLGLKLARWMAESGARSIVLTGRRGLPEREQWDELDPESREGAQVAAVRAVEGLGATVTAVSADVADPDAMRTLFDRFGADMPPLRGVIHAATDLSNLRVADITREPLAAMLRPKVEGTWLLHRLTEDLPLDFFALFSTTTALWGSRDLGHYAAANQFIDALAHYRHARGLPAISINWGTWDEMRASSTEEQEIVVSSGMKPMPSDGALAILGELLGSEDRPQVTVASVDWSLLKPIYELRRPRPFLSRVSNRQAGRPMARASATPELATRLADAPPHQHHDIVVDFLREDVARALGAASALMIDTEQGLFEMGMDSLMSVELRGRIEQAVGTKLPSTLTFNYPNITALADYLLAEVLEPAVTEPVDGADVPVPGVDDDRSDGASADASADATDDMEEDELADMLADRLARFRSGGGR